MIYIHEKTNLKVLNGKNNKLELSQYKNSLASVTNMLALSLPRFFAHLHGKEKSAAVSKLICFSQKRIHSYIFLALNEKKPHQIRIRHGNRPMVNAFKPRHLDEKWAFFAEHNQQPVRWEHVFFALRLKNIWPPRCCKSCRPQVDGIERKGYWEK